MSKKTITINIQEIEPIDILFKNNVGSNHGIIFGNENHDSELNNKLNMYSVDTLDNPNEGNYVILSKDIFKNYNKPLFNKETDASVKIEEIIKKVINHREPMSFITIYICKNPNKLSINKNIYSAIKSRFDNTDYIIYFTFGNPILLEPILRNVNIISDSVTTKYINLLKVIKRQINISEFKLKDELKEYVYNVTIKYGHIKLQSYGTDIYPSVKYKLSSNNKVGTLEAINKSKGRYIFKQNNNSSFEIMISHGIFDMLQYRYGDEYGYILPTNDTSVTNLATNHLDRQMERTDVFYVPKYYNLSNYKSNSTKESLVLFTSINKLYETFPLKRISNNVDPITNIGYMVKSILKNGNHFFIQDKQTEIVKGYDYYKYEVLGEIPKAIKKNNHYVVDKILFKLYTSPKKKNTCNFTKKNISLYLSLLLNNTSRKNTR